MAVNPVKFYADVHIARAVVEALQEAGADFVHAADLGLNRAPDVLHLTTAHQVGRVMVSQDADFQALHRKGAPHSGIAYFRQGAGIGYIVSNLLLMFEVCSAEDMAGKIEYF